MRNIRTLPQLLFRICIRPIFPFGQWLARVTGIAVRAKTVEGTYNRQPFFLGIVRPELSLDDATTHLRSQGFFPNRIAYTDPGQVVSMRRLSDTQPHMQYHIRIFSDGEMRGHFEYTPEDRPFSHLQEKVFEARTEEFLSWTQEILVPKL